MNERIQKLAEQAGMKSPDGFKLTVSHMTTFQLEKFAELIVRECIDILSQNNPCPPETTIMYSLIQDEYFDKGWQVAVETKSNQIKKHFGVEE